MSQSHESVWYFHSDGNLETAECHIGHSLYRIPPGGIEVYKGFGLIAEDYQLQYVIHLGRGGHLPEI